MKSQIWSDLKVHIEDYEMLPVMGDNVLTLLTLGTMLNNQSGEAEDRILDALDTRIRAKLGLSHLKRRFRHKAERRKA